MWKNVWDASLQDNGTKKTPMAADEAVDIAIGESSHH